MHVRISPWLLLLVLSPIPSGPSGRTGHDGASPPGAVEVASPTRQGIRWLVRNEPGEPAFGTMLLEHVPRQLDQAAVDAIEGAREGDRFALGEGFAAVLDTDMPVAIERGKLDPGSYLLLAEKGKKEEWALVFVALEDALDSGWNGSGAPPDVEGEEIAVEAERIEKKGAPRTHVSFGFSANPRTPDLYAGLGPWNFHTVLEPKAKRGQPAAWREEGRRATYRLASSQDVSARGDFVTVGAGLLAHGEELQAQIAGLEAGERFALGKDFWSNLTTSVDLMAGSTKIDAGEYVLALERAKDDGWHLLLLEQERRRKDLLDHYRVQEAKKDLRQVELAHRTLESPGETLVFDLLETDAGLQLEIRFGPHAWTAPLNVATH